jgi:hypothetical protein
MGYEAKDDNDSYFGINFLPLDCGNGSLDGITKLASSCENATFCRSLREVNR